MGNSIVEELDWAVAQNNLEFFIKNQLGYTVAPHHRDWIERLKKHRTCTVSSRDHGKTTIVSIGLPLWVISCLPKINPDDKVDNHDVIIVSNSLDQSESIIEKIKIKIEETESLQSLNWYDSNKSMVRIKEKGNHSKIECKAFGSSGLRGPHPLMCIVDDPLSESKYTMEYIQNFYFNSISGMIAPTGYMHVVGTRFAYNDLYSTLAEPERGYDYKEYPAIDENNKPLWEERYSYEDLMRKRAEVGSLSFAREYLCQPIDSSSSIFPYELLEKQFIPEPFEFVGDGQSKYISAYDLARGGNADSDYFVGITLKKIGQKLRIVDIFRERNIGYREQIREIVRTNDRFKPMFSYVENNNYQILIEQLAAEQMIPVKGRTTGKQNKENAVFLVRSLLEHDMLEIPYADGRTRELIDEMVLEMTAFGYKNGKLMGLSRHDDIITALSMACEAFAEFGKTSPIAGAIGDSNLPLDISGNLEVDMNPIWLSENLMNLGIQ